jgi:hypothetical protein
VGHRGVKREWGRMDIELRLLFGEEYWMDGCDGQTQREIDREIGLDERGRLWNIHTYL